MDGRPRKRETDVTPAAARHKSPQCSGGRVGPAVAATPAKRLSAPIGGPLLARMLRTRIRRGDLRLRFPDGQVQVFGDATGPTIRAHVPDPVWCLRLATDPAMALGDAYMAGALVMEEGQVSDLTDLLGANAVRRPAVAAPPSARWWRDRREQWNDRRESRRNVAAHYDLSLDFYARFLDEDLQYSCAYFIRPGMSLEAAQLAKKRHLAAKLLLNPGQRVLDIGCGWGGLAMTLAEENRVRVDGVTLSGEQLEVATRRVRERNLLQCVRLSLIDYRDLDGPYDRIISVGMFEHVGRPHYRAYFDQLRRLLTDDGVAVIHTIGRADGPGFTQPWIARRIFPGGYIPALSEIVRAVEDAGLIITDIEVLRLHYAETLRHWRERFLARRDEIEAMYDDRFCRMWEFYLAVSETAFRRRDHSVFQIQLARRIDAVPLTRDYLAGI